MEFFDPSLKEKQCRAPPPLQKEQPYPLPSLLHAFFIQIIRKQSIFFFKTLKNSTSAQKAHVHQPPFSFKSMVEFRANVLLFT